MPDKWKDRQKPDLDHILVLMGSSQLSTVITGHLIIESLLVQLIDLKLAKADAFDTFRLNFPQKTDMAVALGLINDKLRIFLQALNVFRNKYAHRLGYLATFVEVFNLCKQAASVGIDFSDDDIHRDPVYSEKSYGIEGILDEVFANTAQELGWYIHENGGEYPFLIETRSLEF